MIVEKKNIRNEWLMVAGFVLVNLVAKGAFISINTGEYTDGILQLTVFENHAGLYPPLYGALAWLIALTGISLELAGRIISVFAAALCVAPVYLLGRRLGGKSAAGFAAVLYTLSPMPWRWSIRVMTDSLYLLLSTGVLVLLIEAWSTIRLPAPEDKGRRRSAGLLAAAVALGALAVLTRYQGILFIPLIGIVAIAHWRRFRQVPIMAIVAAVAWIELPLWVNSNGFVHQQQFASRTSQTLLATVSAWWNALESFLLISPYYFGYPIAAGAIAGCFLEKKIGQVYYPRPTALLWGAYAIMLLGLQAAFGSFQYRYMMPILPIVVALAGVGFAILEMKLVRVRWLFNILLVSSLAHLLLFSLAILIFQREAFGDQREAADFIKKEIPADKRVFSNERYGEFVKLGSVKLSYWSGRKVTPVITGLEPIEAGSILVLGTAYGGDEVVKGLMEQLSTRYQLLPLLQVPLRSDLVPLMDDIMVNPMYNQNALAWVLRYVPQRFATQIFEVQPLQHGGADGR